MDLNRITTDRRALLLSAGALGLGGCAGLDPRPAPGTALFPGTQAVLDRHVTEGKLPGATVGLRLPNGANVYLQAGALDYGPSPAMTRDSLFRIYSMTKPITGAAAALLIEDGRLSLDQPVTDFVPEFAGLTVAIDPEQGLEARPARAVMTMRHLLTHTSGLTYTIMGDGPVQRAYRRAGIFPFTGELGGAPGDGAQVADLDEMVRRLADIPLLAEPGTAMNYSVSLDVMGLVIQRASGMPFPTFVQRRLLDPIGMENTVWRLRSGDARRLAEVHSYSETGRRVETTASAAAYSAPVSLYAGGAGLVSSTRDYLDFLSMLLDGGRAGRVRVMTPATAALIHSNILPPAVQWDGGGYGFGGSVVPPGRPRAGEYGWSGAAGTVCWMDPNLRYAGVIMAQYFPYGAVRIAREARVAIAQDMAAMGAG
jgi:CubicO group peptidase (beta-lactamase class C family)